MRMPASPTPRRLYIIAHDTINLTAATETHTLTAGVSESKAQKVLKNLLASESVDEAVAAAPKRVHTLHFTLIRLHRLSVADSCTMRNRDTKETRIFYIYFVCVCVACAPPSAESQCSESAHCELPHEKQQWNKEDWHNLYRKM